MVITRKLRVCDHEKAESMLSCRSTSLRQLPGSFQVQEPDGDVVEDEDDGIASGDRVKSCSGSVGGDLSSTSDSRDAGDDYHVKTILLTIDACSTTERTFFTMISSYLKA
ncbi:hypothetical protein PPTG_24137 [Phytophthora nicotianae INRA-310]|uniref:Uncharacterized protein n=1 Tax=Phytophthora nicotianae (strain INRA-310) TaxID=761204 RepID=W2PM41_PHYN3|nr:hypothetical protein PPTG_24137 [Phytophthora nicotianae INRA-310]ETN01100.1 hypothetical protein PPTG_24137 [Phytophthora nicotianae INRA-310]